MEIEDLKGKLQVMKHFGQDDAAVQKKIEEMNNELQEKIDDLQDLGSTNKTLIYKERQSNDELHEARKVLIQGLPELLGNRANIGLKRMGELDPKTFHDTCKSRFPPDEAEICWNNGSSKQTNFASKARRNRNKRKQAGNLNAQTKFL
ncbi:hypothetical protein Gotur_004324 [Gossypium turneri]